MSFPESVAIIGLGLMGGSLARDLAVRGVRVLAYDPEPGVVDQGLREGVLSERLDDRLVGASHVDLAVIATPVDAAIPVLTRLAETLEPRALITDLGSTKRAIGRAAVDLGVADRFVGSHPLAGDHRFGWAASRKDLYANSLVYLCPTGDDTPVLDQIGAFWRSLGARPEVVDAHDHDHRMAWVSHLPQVMASALAATLARDGRRADELGGGGRDMTRLAASSPAMWAAICHQNADQLAPALDYLQAELTRFRDALDQDDSRALGELFSHAREWTR